MGLFHRMSNYIMEFRKDPYLDLYYLLSTHLQLLTSLEIWIICSHLRGWYTTLCTFWFEWSQWWNVSPSTCWGMYFRIKSWKTVNKLKLNDEKTEFLIMTSKFHQNKIHDHQIKVDTASIPASESARNLGIVFDKNLCMEDQIRRICQSVYFHIRNVNSIRKILSNETAATIIHALITSRIDNGNSLLTGVTDYSLRKLQLAQNAAARILTKARKFDHITPILKDLHWLPVRERINFKLLLLTWKAINGLAPSYISNLLVPYKPVRALRSSDKHLLTVPRILLHLEIVHFQLLLLLFGIHYLLISDVVTLFNHLRLCFKTYLYNKVYNW